MPNRLPIPPELQQLVEKRELPDRRSSKARKEAKGGESKGSLASQESPPQVERRKKSRRKSDAK